MMFRQLSTPERLLRRDISRTSTHVQFLHRSHTQIQWMEKKNGKIKMPPPEFRVK
jgi:hypothetical protein